MTDADSSKKPNKVGLVGATAVVIGNMIGVGVFTSLGFQLFDLDHGFPLILLWVIGGFYALCGSFCYAELTAAFPRSGGEYHLLSQVYHPALGFMSGWLSVTVGFAAPVALAAMAFGTYLHGTYESMDAKHLSFAVVVFVACVHLWKVRFAAGFQSVFTAGKIILILVLIVCAFAMATPQEISFLPMPGDAEQIRQAGFAVSMIYVTYAYAGWNAAVYIAGEVRNPQRNVPLALVTGTLIVTVLYVAVNAAFLYSAPMEEMKGREDVALVAARSIFGEEGGNFMGLLIAFGLISAVSAMTWAGPRISMVAGQDYRPLRLLAKTSRAGIPVVAIILQTIITLALLATQTFETVLLYIEYAFLFSLSITVFGVFWLRIRQPGLKRPYKTPLYPVTPILFLAMNAWIGYHTMSKKPVQSLLGLATLASGLLVWGIVFLIMKKQNTSNGPS